MLIQQAEEAGQIFGIPSEVAIHVLSRIQVRVKNNLANVALWRTDRSLLQWNTSLIAEADSMEAFLRRHGTSTAPWKTPTGLVTCDTCYAEDLLPKDAFSLSCGHISCRECWQINISTALNGYQPNQIRCPGHDCELCLLPRHVKDLGGVRGCMCVCVRMYVGE